MCKLFADNRNACNLKEEKNSLKFACFIIGSRPFGITSWFFQVSTQKSTFL